MSEQAAGAQADAQGAEPTAPDSTGSPNAPYLADVPGELHPLVEEVLRKKDADFTKRFQQASEFRNQWEPYSKIDGLNQLPPDEVANLVEFYNTMNDPQAFIAWYEGAGQQLQEQFGYDPYGNLDEDSWVQVGQQNGWFDADDPEAGGDDTGGGLDPNSIQAMIQEAIQQEMAPVKQFMGSQEQQQMVSQFRSELEDRYKSLLAEHQLEENDDLRDDILTLANAFAADEGEDDPIGRAFEKYLRMTGKAQGDLIDRKLGNQNGSTLGNGAPDTQPEKYAHDDPRIREAVLNRIRG